MADALRGSRSGGRLRCLGARGNPGWAWADVLPAFRRLETDLDFGEGGRVKRDFGTAARVYGAAVQPDGKILVMGKALPHGPSDMSDVILMRHLAALARDADLKELVAEVLPENTAMLKLFKKFGFRPDSKGSPQVVHLTLQLP